MLLILGVLLLALCVLAFLWALSAYRRPDRPGWTRHEGNGAFVTLAIMLLGALGLGFLLKFGLEFRTQSFTLVDAALTVAILAGAVVLGRRLMAVIRQHRQASASKPRAVARRRGRVVALAASRGAARPRSRPRKAA